MALAALLSVTPDELRRAPVRTEDEEERTFEIGDNLHTVLAAVIQQTMNIEGLHLPQSVALPLPALWEH